MPHSLIAAHGSRHCKTFTVQFHFLQFTSARAFFRSRKQQNQIEFLLFSCDKIINCVFCLQFILKIRKTTKMSTDKWKHEMHAMLEIFHRQAVISLQRIIASLEAEGRSFNSEFRDIFFKMSSNT